MRNSLFRLMLLFAPFVLVLISSCGSIKKTKYYQDIPDSGMLKNIPKAEYTEPKIQVDDILTILLQTVDPQASALINQSNVNGTPTVSTSVPGANTSSPMGYLVNKEGYVDIPVIGKIKLVGLTTTQASAAISSAADNFYKDHSVIVRFANFKINVDGEVARPGSYIMPNEKVTILDALTIAGDLTIFGERENVLLIRENPDGSRTPYRINLKRTDFMSSPYFYLKQNDYIYVQPDKSKAVATDAEQTKIYTIIGAILSVLIIVASRIKY